jgi:hypothetical protein
MRDTSFLDEINAYRHKRKGRLKYFILFAFLIIFITSYGATTAINSAHKNKNKQLKSTEQNIDTNSVQSNADSNVLPSTSPTNTTNTSPVTPPASTQNNQQAAIQAGNIKLCQSYIKNAQSISDSYRKMFFDGWSSWNTTYAGQTDSPTALASKEWNKNYIKNLFNDYISQNNPTYVDACYPVGTKGSIGDYMLQPNYDAW